MTLYADWLNSSDKIPCIILEVQAFDGANEKTLYFSSKAYVGNNVSYNSVIKSESVNIVEALNLSGGSSFSFSDVQIHNVDGSNDYLLNYVFSNRSANVYYGDVRWDRSAFEPVFYGVVEDIDCNEKDSLIFKIKDKLQRLNTPISENTLGGSTPNKDVLLPLTFGECFNVNPLLIDPSQLKYQWHQGPSEKLIEVRDNGVPVNKSTNLNTSTFTLSASPYGQITASVQGDKNSTYINTVANVISRVVTGFGEANNRFTLNDIDTSNFSDFNNTNNASIGVYVTSGVSVIDVISRVAASAGAQVTMNSLGKLQLKKVTLTGNVDHIIEVKDIILNSLSVVQKMPVQGSFKIGYCKNWTIQEDLQTGIPSKHKALYAKEISEVKAEESNVKIRYKQLIENERLDTLLLKSTHAQSLANSLLSVWSVPRFIVEMTLTPKFFEIQIGDLVNITHPRFDFENGKNGQVIGKNINLNNNLITIKVLV